MNFNKSNFEFISEKDSNFSKNITQNFNKKLIITNIQDFADTETAVYLENQELIKDKVIFVIKELDFDFFYSQKTLQDKLNGQIFKLLSLVDLIKKIGATKIILIIPYLPYSRQDKTTCKKFIGLISLEGNLFKSSGINELITFDLHDPSIKEFFPIKIHEILLNNFWADFFKNKIKEDLNNYIIASPDKGRVPSDQTIAQLLNLNLVYIEKKRIDKDQPVSINLFGQVKDKNIILIDDILDTGKTAINSCNLLKQNGAKNIWGAFSHAVLSKDSIENLINSPFDKIFLTNSINHDNNLLKNNKFEILSVDNLLINFLKELKNEQ